VGIGLVVVVVVEAVEDDLESIDAAVGLLAISFGGTSGEGDLPA